MRRALIVTDIQNDFLPGGALAVPDGDQIIAFVVAQLKSEGAYELFVAVQDWHPAEHGSFASVHRGAEPFQLGELDGIAQVFWPDHCVQGSDGARIAKKIRDRLVEITRSGAKTILIKKGQDPRVDSYSAFFDNARRHDTGLARALKEYDITAVDVVGLAFDYCVKATALDAASLGFATRVLMPGTRAIDASAIASVIAELNEAGIECLDGAT